MNSGSAPSETVSIIIPTHNRAKLLPDALNSALTQGEHVTEVIVVDDGSTDDTPAIMRQWPDSRLIYHQQPQSGPAAARDRGVKHATGSYLMFLDSDDMLPPGSVERLLSVARHSPGEIPFGRASVHPNDPLGPHDYDFAIAERSGELLPELAFYNSGTIFASLFPRDMLKEAGGVTGTGCCHDCEDHDLALRLAVRYKFVYLPEIVYRIRMHQGNRHRSLLKQVWSCQRDAVARNLHQQGHHFLRRRAMAYFQGRIANALLQDGHTREAAQNYLRALWLWPVKKEAWKGLGRSLSRSKGTAS
jgi:glycosyltransferase involved in cell wall biosynthesis